MSIFIEAADPVSMVELKKAYYSKYLFVHNCSPAEVNIDDIRDVTTNINVLQNSVLHDYKFFYNYMYSSFLEFLTEVSKFDSNATPKDYLWNSKGLIPSSVYQNAESFSDIFTNIKSTIFKLDKNDLMTDEIRNQIEEAAKKLNRCIRGSRYLITNTAGKKTLESIIHQNMIWYLLMIIKTILLKIWIMFKYITMDCILIEMMHINHMILLKKKFERKTEI
eukprot:jgi/Orpsp1_1/1180045/evm.model.c7180000071952.1